MIQRIQTVYLFLAAVVAVLCLSLPIAQVVSNGGLDRMVVYNFFVMKSDGTRELLIYPAALLLVMASENVASIFLYKNRPLQKIMAVASGVSYLVYFGLLALCANQLCGAKSDADFQASLVSYLPLASSVFSFLAAYRINKDDKLVKSLDRLR